MSTRIMSTCFSSVMSFLKGLIRSMVIVEEEVSTREDSVDMDAESTSTTSSPIRASGRASLIIPGIMASYSSFPFARVARAVLPASPVVVAYSLPKPPRK